MKQKEISQEKKCRLTNSNFGNTQYLIVRSCDPEMIKLVDNLRIKQHKLK